MHALSSSGGNSGSASNYRGHSTNLFSVNRSDSHRRNDVTETKRRDGSVRLLSRERRTCKEQCEKTNIEHLAIVELTYKK